MMVKAYWINCYRSVTDEAALARYVKVAGPAIVARGGRILARGLPAKTYEAGLAERTVVIEFESLERAIAAFESPEYQAAADILRGVAERDIRIVPGE